MTKSLSILVFAGAACSGAVPADGPSPATPPAVVGGAGGGAEMTGAGGMIAPPPVPPPPVTLSMPRGPTCDYLPTRLYWMSPVQIRRNFEVVLGTAAPGPEFEGALATAAPHPAPFSTGEQVMSVSPGFAETIYNAARTAAATAVGMLPRLHSCYGVGITRPCMTSFIADFGARLWRRPWSDEEVMAYLAFYDSYARIDPKRAVEFVIRRMMTAPDSIFRFEIGYPADAQGLTLLTPHEMASALSFTLTDGPPDAMLWNAAKQGALQTRGEVEAHARRLLASPDVARNVVDFFDELVPGESQAGIPDQVEELRRFVSHALWTDAGTFTTLLTAPYTFANAALQKHYGWTALPPATDWRMVAPPAAEGRSGLLTQGVALNRKTNRSARGKFVRASFLCSYVPDPPPDVNQNLDDQKAALAAKLGRQPTTDEAREAHISNPACSGCHGSIDPLGQPFEPFDRAGIFRAQNPETQRPYVTAAQITGTGQIDGMVKDAPALGKALAASPAAAECFIRQAFEYVMGRPATEADQCHLADLKTRFVASGGKVRDLFVDIVTSDAFRVRAVGK